MATRMNIYHTPRPIEGFLAEFAGRESMVGYDDTKPIKIGEENRDYVWDEERERGFIMSILSGYPIPQMLLVNNAIVDGGNRSTVLWRFQRGEFMVKVGEWQGNYGAMTPALSARWNQCMIPMTVVTHATDEERANIFEKFNHGVQLTFGQKIWNRKYLPLAGEAEKLVYGRDFPLRDLVTRVWKPRWKKTENRSELGLGYQVIAGCMFGASYCSKRFSGAAIHLLMNTRREQIDHSNLQAILEVFDRAVAASGQVPAKHVEWVFKNFIVAAIHDYHTSRDMFTAKWRDFLLQAYRTPRAELNRIKEVGTARANAVSRIAMLSENISEYVAGLDVDGATEYTYASDEEGESEDA